MALPNPHKYDDIIDLPRPVSRRRSRMTDLDRAAQFSPFAALTGYEDAIDETARLTDARIELDEGARAMLDETFQKLRAQLSSRPKVTVTWFIQDQRKAGGAYATVRGRVRKIDDYAGLLILTDGEVIPLAEITDIRFECLEYPG